MAENVVEIEKTQHFDITDHIKCCTPDFALSQTCTFYRIWTIRYVKCISLIYIIVIRVLDTLDQ